MENLMPELPHWMGQVLSPKGTRHIASGCKYGYTLCGQSWERWNRYPRDFHRLFPVNCKKCLKIDKGEHHVS